MGKHELMLNIIFHSPRILASILLNFCVCSLIWFTNSTDKMSLIEITESQSKQIKHILERLAP